MMRLWRTANFEEVNVWLSAICLLVSLSQTGCSPMDRSLYSRVPLLRRFEAKRRADAAAAAGLTAAVVSSASSAAAGVGVDGASSSPSSGSSGLTAAMGSEAESTAVISGSVAASSGGVAAPETHTPVPHLTRFIEQLDFDHIELRRILLSLFEHRRCPGDSNRCANGMACYPRAHMCDGFTECADGSDEHDCESKLCPLDSQVKCEDQRQCIQFSSFCDGTTDCYDNSDEANCVISPCAPWEAMCQDGSGCYQTSWACDGVIDCRDGSDESNCHLRACENGWMKCRDGLQCISPFWLCDNQTFCADHSDEIGCDMGDSDFEEPQNRTWDLCTGNTPHACADQSRCYPSMFRCDNHTACADGSDERDCGFWDRLAACPERTLPCETGVQCISCRALCDGVNDCDDGSDEYDCAINEYRTSYYSDMSDMLC